MRGVGVLNHTCQGESHKVLDKPCQDYSLSESKGAFAMAIVSDGHGGARYFRSDKGSEIAVNVAKKAIDGFVKDPSTSNIFQSEGVVQYGVAPNACNDDVYRSLSWLVSYIIRQWNCNIRKHAESNDITEWEKSHVDEKYLSDFRCGLQSDNGVLEKIYGCTLMAYVMTENYWFSFQIGDGKMVFFKVGEHGMEAKQLIPWDEQCFLNRTTSICDSDAASEFRFAYCGNGTFPEAVFLGSDGIDDTYGDGDRLTDFYIRLYKEIATSSPKQVLKTLESDLPRISKMGSQDDMSIACVFCKYPGKRRQNALQMSQWQLAKLHQESEELENKKAGLREKIERLKDTRELSESGRIELIYARNDLGRVKDAIEKIERSVQTIQAFDRDLNKRD
ncbi:MAG: hypothetical protein HDT28_07675 [Clostridiales bacterium]|nr:hypothetical protein [Clostridiales bacterium]